MKIPYLILLCSVVLCFHFSFGQSHFGKKQIIADSLPNETLELAYDMNQDGAVDLILFEKDTTSGNTNASLGTHVIRYNDGSNHFGSPMLLKEDDTDWTRLTPLDVDLDGDIDLVLYQKDLKKLTLLRNDSTQGFAWGNDIVADIKNEIKYDFGDLNHDQFPDLAFNEYLSAEDDSVHVDWYLNDGSGNFTRQARLFDENIYLGADDLHIADLDADGWNDIFLAIETRLLVYHNQQNGTFQQDTIFDSGFYNQEDFFSVSHLAYQDLNHDSIPDLSFIASYYNYDENRFRYDLLVYLNNGDTTFSLWQAILGEEGTFTNFEIADVDHDDDPDIVASSRDEYGVGPAASVLLYKNDNFGGFTTADTLYRNQSLYALTDFEGNGNTDIVTQGVQGLYAAAYGQPQTLVYGFLPSFQLDYPINTKLLVTPDINGDNLPDITLGSLGKISTFLNGDSTQRFAGWFAVDQFNAFPNTLADGEFNGDHQTEIVAAVLNSVSNLGKFSLYQISGNTQGQEQLLDSGNFDSNAVFVADIDHDGDQDIISQYEKGGIYYKLFVNGGNLSFTESAPIDGNTFGKIDGLVDFNSDSLVDLVIWFNGSFNILLNGGTGNFADPGIEVIASQGANLTYLNTHWADMNGDGYVDAVSAGVFYKNTAGTGLTAAFTPVNAVNIASSLPLDVDHDGDLDIVANNSLGGIIWFENTDGLGHFTESQDLLNEKAEVFFGKDLDHDGDEDLITLSSGELAWYQNISSSQPDTTLQLYLVGQNAYPSEEITVPLRVKGFQNLKTLQLSLQWFGDILDFTGVDGFAFASLDSTDFVLGSLNSDSLSLMWTDTVPQALADEDTLLLLHFKVKGDTATSANISFIGEPKAINMAGDTLIAVTTSAQITVLHNSAPTDITLSHEAIAENKPRDTFIGYFTTEDPDSADQHTYSLVAGAGDNNNGFFVIQGDSLFSSQSFDYENKTQDSIRVQSDDGKGGTFAKLFIITITDVTDNPNQTPVNLALSNNTIDENKPKGTVIGEFSADDPDHDPLVYSLAAGSTAVDNPYFDVVENKLVNRGSFDYEMQNEFHIKAQADDNRGGVVTKAFTIVVNDLEDSPNTPPSDIALSNQRVDENLPAGTVIGILTTVDADAADVHAYALVAGEGSEDNSQFMIAGDTLKSAATFDYETKAGYSIRIQTDDGRGGTFTKILVITINDAEENAVPTALILSKDSVDEKRPVGTLVGIFSAEDPDPDNTFSYYLVAGEGSEDNGAFTIDTDQLLTNAKFDFAVKNQYHIRVQVQDGHGGTFEQTFVIKVNNVKKNHPPVAQHPIPDQIAMVDQLFIYVVPDTIFADPDEGDVLTYSATVGDTTALPKWLAFDAKNKTFIGTPTKDYVDTVMIRVTAKDTKGAKASTDFTLAVEPVTGLSDAFTQQVKVFPVPADGNMLEVELTQIFRPLYTFTIFSMDGKVVREGKIVLGNKRTANINIAAIPAGTYLLELRTEKESIRKSIIIR